MAIDFKTPADIASEYLLTLKSLKPEVNIDQQDSDWYVRGQVVGGVVSGLYQDQRKVNDDGFPASARLDAVERHLFTYFNAGFRPAAQAEGTVLVGGTIGQPVPINTEFLHQSTGNTYRATSTVVLTAVTGEVPVRSVDTGQNQNLLAGTTLKISTPPAGINSSATVLQPIADGKDQETIDEAVQRILDFVRQSRRGGTEGDYKAWALEADNSVSSASVKRYITGFGSVGVYFTAGTTDIDKAIDAGSAVVRIPSDALVTIVQAYIDALNPVTDCLTVVKPTEITQDVWAYIAWADGYSGATILSGQTLTLDQLVRREIDRALYKVPIGGDKVGSQGYVLASKIEANIDEKLSIGPYTIGEIGPVIKDRQVFLTAPSGTQRALNVQEIVAPGTYHITEV